MQQPDFPLWREQQNKKPQAALTSIHRLATAELTPFWIDGQRHMNHNDHINSYKIGGNMQTVVSAMEVRQKFGEILNRVSLTGEEIIIERAGKKIARIVPLESNQTRQQAHGKLDFRKAAGLGKEIWQEINAEQYLESERNSWD